MVRMFLNGPNDPKHVFLLSYEELNLLVIVFILGALVWKNLKKQMEWKSSFFKKFCFFQKIFLIKKLHFRSVAIFLATLEKIF